MDQVHSLGVSAIQVLQKSFENQSELMLLMSQFGDPRNAFLLAFPLAFSLHHSIGKRVLWVAAISEWLNAVFKWVLHGERPYWWVHNTDFYTDANRPVLNQFRLTCETGPGSPSGHAMVTSAVFFIFASDSLHYSETKSKLVKLMTWLAFLVMVVAVNLSRCFIATHFPHQVIAGAITGMVIASLCNGLSTHLLGLRHYVVSAVFFVSSILMMYYGLTVLAMDPLWSVREAVAWCARKEWVHLDTTLFYAVARDASCLLGLGIGIHLSKTDHEDHAASTMDRILQACVGLALCQATEMLKPPVSPALLFYLLAGLKHLLLFVLLVAVVPLLRPFSSRTRPSPQCKGKQC